MKKNELIFLISIVFVLSASSVLGQQFKPQLVRSSEKELILNFEAPEYSIIKSAKGAPGNHQIVFPDIMLPAESGCPDLPVYSGRFIVPQGAQVKLEYKIISSRIVTGIQLSPAPDIPLETEDGLHYSIKQEVYGRDAFYPYETVKISEPNKLREFQSMMIRYAPIRYNPVKEELQLITKAQVKISFQGGTSMANTGQQSAVWNQIISAQVINPGILPKVQEKTAFLRSEGCEYLIIIPNDAAWRPWADSLALFRNEQGIKTQIVTLEEIGGNSVQEISGYLHNAWVNWDIRPSAVLFAADYGVSDANRIISPVYNDYCISDNLFADMDNDGLPEFATARMTARSAGQFRDMVKKALNYERSPVTEASFYDTPVTALGWQTERWFQLCSEAVSGYFRSKGKNPLRINDIYEGNPYSDPWSSASNTYTILNKFGPNGLDYIPESPSDLGGWNGGNADDVNAALNQGTFMLVHRDHGGVSGWGEPSYGSNDINQGFNDNEKLPFIFSINCLTGKFNVGGDCFAETFHRNPARAVGLIAATEVSYSFVNDTYMWGMMDYMFPDFLPDMGTPGQPNLYPAFANVYGKYFLQASSWPWNENNKMVTYMLFHHHGDAYQQLFSEVPQDIAATIPEKITDTTKILTVTAPQGCLIGISNNGELLSKATASGSEQPIEVPLLQAGEHLKIVITGPNYKRFTGYVQVIPSNAPYLICKDFAWESESGQFESGKSAGWSFRLANIGSANAHNINLSFATDSSFVQITQEEISAGILQSDSSLLVEAKVEFTADCGIADGSAVPVCIDIEESGNSRQQEVIVYVHAPKPKFDGHQITETTGNGDTWLAPGEQGVLSLFVSNEGSAELNHIDGSFRFIQDYPFLEIREIDGPTENIAAGATDTVDISFAVAPYTAEGVSYDLELNLNAACEFSYTDSVPVQIGRKTALVIDLDRNHNSGDSLYASLTQLGYTADITRVWPLNIEEYKSVFICLGMFGTNDVLMPSEGRDLAKYLESGGRLYLEGGDFWKFNPVTDVHPYFHVEGLADGSDDLKQVNATYGAFTQNMSFTYNGDNACVDHIKGIDGAVNIFYNPEKDYFTAVAYEGSLYRTIGTSFEFGGLTDAEGISNKTELAKRYMEFFGIYLRPGAPEKPSGEPMPCVGNTEPYTAGQQADSSGWLLIPTEAATMEILDSAVMLHWNGTFTGTAELYNYIYENGLAGGLSDPLEISMHHLPQVPQKPAGPDSLIRRETDLASSYYLEGSGSFIWKIEPENAGSLQSSEDSLHISWANGYIGSALISAAAENKCGQSAFGSALKINIYSSAAIGKTGHREISLFPNPASETISLRASLKSEANINIRNNAGSLLQNLNWNGRQPLHIDVSAYDNGLYYLQIISDKEVKSLKFIVLH